MRDGGTGRRGALRRWTIGLGLGACALIAIGGLSAMALVQESPTWWRTIHADDPRTIETARRLENGVVSELHHARARADDAGPAETLWRSDDWTVALRAADANAWLSARLPRWLASYDDEVDWPAELSELQVQFEEDRIHVGAKIDVDGHDRVFSATLRPVMRDDGSIWMRADTVRVGRLGLPAAWVLQDSERLIRAYVPEEFRGFEETEGMFSAFRGELPLVNEPVITLEDGRRVRLLALASRRGYLEITCRTEKE